MGHEAMKGLGLHPAAMGGREALDSESHCAQSQSMGLEFPWSSVSYSLFFSLRGQHHEPPAFGEYKIFIFST